MTRLRDRDVLSQTLSLPHSISKLVLIAITQNSSHIRQSELNLELDSKFL